MGEIADMMLDGLLDEETGEYIGDINEGYYGTEAPGFPVSYERERRQRIEKGLRSRKSPFVEVRLPMHTKVVCPYCHRKVKAEGYLQHYAMKHEDKRDEHV